MKKAIIYGAGNNCQNTVDIAKDAGYEILAVADRDEKKIGTEIGGGILTISPDQINDYAYDCIIVSIIRNYNDIVKSLVALGVEKERIRHFGYFSVVKNPKNTGSMKIDWSRQLTTDEVYDELCRHADEYNDLEKEFLLGEHNRSFKWVHYFEIYHRYFEKYRNKPITIMEVGVNKGGSIQLWKKYFGPQARIIGVDITPACKAIEDEQVKIYIGNQEDRDFWRKVKEEVPKVDILIDDGGHYMQQQIVTFEEMFPHVADNGIYMCEDTGTSYNHKKYSAGYKNPDTWAEYSKNFIDYIHAWFSDDKDLQVNEYTKNMFSVSYYTGVCVIEKRPMYAPFDMEVTNLNGESNVCCHLHGDK